MYLLPLLFIPLYRSKFPYYFPSSYRSSFNSFYSVGLQVINSLSFHRCEKVFISSFWKFFSLNSRLSVLAFSPLKRLLHCNISDEVSAVINLCFPVHDWYFSPLWLLLRLFSLSLSLVLCSLILLCLSRIFLMVLVLGLRWASWLMNV